MMPATIRPPRPSDRPMASPCLVVLECRAVRAVGSSSKRLRPPVASGLLVFVGTLVKGSRMMMEIEGEGLRVELLMVGAREVAVGSLMEAEGCFVAREETVASELDALELC